MGNFLSEEAERRYEESEEESGDEWVGGEVPIERGDFAREEGLNVNP